MDKLCYKRHGTVNVHEEPHDETEAEQQEGEEPSWKLNKDDFRIRFRVCFLSWQLVDDKGGIDSLITKYMYIYTV